MTNPTKLTTPPLYSVEAESAVIGGLILDNSTFDEVISKINASDFHIAVHQILFKGISALIEAGNAVQTLFTRPLPKIHYQFGPMKLYEALQMIAGPAYEMTLNDISRTVCFKARESSFQNPHKPSVAVSGKLILWLRQKHVIFIPVSRPLCSRER